MDWLSSKPPLHQLSHPTRFVAGVGIVWHTSAHKRRPLFHRRAPAWNTVVPEGSPGISHARGQETLRITNCNHRSRGHGKRSEMKIPSSLQRREPLDACRCRRWRHVGVAPLGAGPRLATAGKRGRGRMFVASVRLRRAAPLTWGATFCTG